MQHLFSPEGESALARTLQHRPLLAFDFDGTLTPIVARPNDAHLSKGVSARLAMLAAHLPVAIVTGRSIDDVRGRLGFEPRFIVGNHGAEEEGRVAAAGEQSEALSRLRLRLRERLPALSAAGVTVEDKGHSMALHYRLSRTRERALQLITELLADHDDALRVFGGKLVVNVVPSVAPDKADAVRALVHRSGVVCAIFAGDDVNDEPVFATAPAGWLTIRVGRDDPRSKAQWFLDSPGEMALLLERMVSLLALR
ncbi:MAG: trehalose-phosphatase [Betaproteobacteria bacterium]|nr:trehalose-phosphatase [Betaproteobacteria bacterium]